MSDELFTVVCTDVSPNARWQTELLEHTWARVGMPGELIHLAAVDDHALPKHQFARVVGTKSRSNSHPRLSTGYVPMNRLLSLQAWLEDERPVGTVLLLDCDMVFRAPVHQRSSPGAP
ncbi:MAG: hypothetical protein GY926_01340, partial [bacterium]|nr:hypothetical protein [bacterium]